MVKVPPLHRSLLERIATDPRCVGERVPQWHLPHRDALRCEAKPDGRVFTVIVAGTVTSTGDAQLIASMARALHRRAA